MALAGVKVLELAGLAPAPFCGMLLAEFGATVIRLDKLVFTPDVDTISHGKKSVAINLKHPQGAKVFRRMCKTSDVLIEPFRKGVMEKLGLGPDILLSDNHRLIYARLTGYGQYGLYSNSAGHDINYVAISGILSLLGGRGKEPMPPCNLLADFAGGGLMCALGILMALYERQNSGKGQIIDCNMVEGTAYLASWITRGKHTPFWTHPRGQNVLDGGAYCYTSYETKDGQWMAVGALEPQFYDALLNGLGLTHEEVPQFQDDYDKYHKIFADKFKQRTRDEWCKIFDGTDACVTPVLSLAEAEKHPHNTSRNTFTRSYEGDITARPSPLLSRTPANSLASEPRPVPGQHTFEVLTSFGYSMDELQELKKVGAISDDNKSKL